MLKSVNSFGLLITDVYLYSDNNKQKNRNYENRNQKI